MLTDMPIVDMLNNLQHDTGGAAHAVRDGRWMVGNDLVGEYCSLYSCSSTEEIYIGHANPRDIGTGGGSNRPVLIIWAGPVLKVTEG